MPNIRLSDVADIKVFVNYETDTSYMKITYGKPDEIPCVYYWRSTNHGETWEGVLDRQDEETIELLLALAPQEETQA